MKAVHRNESSDSYWHTYTQPQIEACAEVCRMIVEKYGVNLILGHEEIAPKRKRDPGPAFPLDTFRNSLLLQNRSDEGQLIDKSGTVVASLLNIRNDAGSQHEKVAKPLIHGKKVKVLEEKDGWLKVETTVTGWVGKAYIELDK